ncbi:MAG: flagellar filament capping protein FliD [Alphaproteobacteria bacterium]|nr:flagellar filament capping protein FliD [Alphaproteobacteria bacterium]
MVTSINLGGFFNSGGRTVLGGGVSGLDTETLVNALVEAKKIPATRLQDKVDLNSDKISALNEFKQLLKSLQTATDFLRNPPGVQNAASNAFKYRGTTISSNDGTVAASHLTVTADPGTPLGSYNIEVLQVAQAKQQNVNGTFAIADANQQVVFAAPVGNQFGDGTLTINGATIDFNDGDTLADIAYKFNAVTGTTNIQANIIQVASGQYGLSFKSTKTGLAYDFDMAAAVDVGGVLANITFTDTQIAQDASINLDGVNLTRSTNTISDAVTGLNINLLTAKPATIFTTTVISDVETIQTSIENFVTTYNNLRVFAAEQTQRNGDGSPAEDSVLLNNSAFKSAVSSAATAILRSVPGVASGDFQSLAEIGITLTDFEGDSETPEVKNIMTIDASKLQSAIANNFDQVRRVFEFDFRPASSNLQVISRTNALSAYEFRVEVDSVGDTATAYLQVGGVDTGVFYALDYAETTTGISLKGQAGTPFEGLVMFQNGINDSDTHVDISHGVGDYLYNSLTTFLTSQTGQLDVEIKALSDNNTDYEEQIVKINEQVERFRQQQLEKFAALERAIASINTLLQSLDAQQRAREQG